jgi:hypothetical protein
MSISEKFYKMQKMPLPSFSRTFNLSTSVLVLTIDISHATPPSSVPSPASIWATSFSCSHILSQNKLQPPSQTSSKEDGATASLGVWGHFNKIFQEKLSKDAPQASNAPLEPNYPSNLKVSQNQKTQIISHKATYSIHLDKSNDDISDAIGEMTINIFDTGDGYVFEQNSTLTLYNSDGVEEEQIVTNHTTWQGYGGDYRFTCRTIRNGEEETIKGHVVKRGDNKTAEVIYQLPTPTQVWIPYKTVFPLDHLIRSLEAAQKGEPSLTMPIFDGSNETYEAVKVDTLFGMPQPSKLKLKNETENTGEMHLNTMWPMHISVYPLESPSPDPEYEMSQNVLEGGIIRDMTLDYGAFAIKAELKHLILYKSSEMTASKGVDVIKEEDVPLPLRVKAPDV